MPDPKAESARFDALRLLGKDGSETLNRADLPAATRARMDTGKALRGSVPRSTFGSWAPHADRPDPISILEEQAAIRVPELIPIRHGRMLVSPFAFFRGGAAIMAWDLAQMASPGIRVQLCGDAHLVNFGAYAAPDRQLVFDLNDFDETLPGPFEWDLLRLAASVEIAARDNGFNPADRRKAVHATVDAFQATIELIASMRLADGWYSRIDLDRVLEFVEESGTDEGRKQTRKEIAKAKRKTSIGALSRFAEQVGDTFRIRDEPPLIVHFEKGAFRDPERIVMEGLAGYSKTLQPDRAALLSRYRFVDFARKVVGVGSVGTEAFMVLLMGDRDDDPLFIQIKEAQMSVLEPYAGPSEYSHHGERVVQGQRMMQGASDSFLGWVTGNGPRTLDYYLRQLRDMKGSAVVETMSQTRLASYGELCGATLARAHGRAGDAATIAGYVGRGEVLREAIADFSSAYADQNEIDHADLAEAVRSGRVEAEAGL